MTTRPAPSGRRLASLRGLFATFASFALVCAFAWSGVAQAQPRATPWISIEKWGWGPQDEGRVTQGASIQLDVNRLLGKQNAILDLQLPGNKLLVLRKTGQDVLIEGAFTWHGTVQAGAGGTAFFTVVNGVAFGTIFEASGRILRIRQKDGKLYAIEQIDQSKFRSDHRSVEIQRPPPPRAEHESLTSPDWCATTAAQFDESECGTDSPDFIDVLVLYTPAARVAALTQSGIQAEIVNAIAVTNSGYTASGIFQQIRLRAAVEVAYGEARDSTGHGIVFDDLCNLHDPSPGRVESCVNQMLTSPRRPVPMAESLRDQHAADAVVMIVDSDVAGLAYQTTWVSAAAGANAYSVVPLNAASVFFTLAHELGHVMAARHDWDSAPGNDNEPYHFNHGLVQLATTPLGAVPWFTIMAERTPAIDQSPACTPPSPSDPSPCVRRDVWSNPDILDSKGNPTGVATEPRPADNRRTLNCTAIAVANFRCSSPTPGGVWMKDAWSDTGAEPEPSLASAPMWKSPYIWVRTSRDTDRIHAHQHENPVFGPLSNWAYVKVHNSGTASASGTLELYYADASLSLVWPAGWKLISSVPVASFPGASTKILEFEWNHLPGPGHFCLLARWVGSGTVFTTPEGPDIDANVRGNNTIVWRNVDVIDLSVNAAAGAEVLVRNPDDSSAGSTIEIRAVPRAGQGSFFDFGKVTLEPDKTMHTRNLASLPVLVASKSGVVLSDLNLDPGAQGSIRLTFLRSSTAPYPRGTYEIDVVQTQFRDGKKIMVGGVTYQIHTDLSAK